MLDPFTPKPAPPVRTPTETERINSACHTIKTIIATQAVQMKANDTAIKTALYGRGLSEKIFAKLKKDGVITEEKLQEMAIVNKTVIELFWPGTFDPSDPVPLAEIVMPG